MPRDIDHTPCGCAIDTRCAIAYRLREAYHAATTLSARIEVGQAYTHHLRMAHLLEPLADAHPIGAYPWDEEPMP